MQINDISTPLTFLTNTTVSIAKLLYIIKEYLLFSVRKQGFGVNSLSYGMYLGAFFLSTLLTIFHHISASFTAYNSVQLLDFDLLCGLILVYSLMRFLFVKPEICRHLPSDFTSR